MAANAKLREAMSRVHAAFSPPESLTAATVKGPPGHRRYAQDVAVELQYQAVRRHGSAFAEEVLAKEKMNDLRRLSASQRGETWNTETAWRVARLLEQLDVAYGGGDADAACALLAELKSLRIPADRP
jgi:hypothetical protein